MKALACLGLGVVVHLIDGKLCSCVSVCNELNRKIQTGLVL